MIIRRDGREIERRIERRIRRADNDPFGLDNQQFINLFRLTKEMTRDIIMANLMPMTNYSRHPAAVHPSLRILTTLWFYANGAYQRVLIEGCLMNLTQTTISKCIAEVTNLIVDNLAPMWIVFPMTFEEKLRI